MSNTVSQSHQAHPEEVIAHLHTLQSQIDEVAPLTTEQRKLVRQRVRTQPKPIVEASINVMGVMDNLFVSAEGAGYILDAQSRTLVETLGTEVEG